MGKTLALIKNPTVIAAIIGVTGLLVTSYFKEEPKPIVSISGVSQSGNGPNIVAGGNVSIGLSPETAAKLIDENISLRKELDEARKTAQKQNTPAATEALRQFEQENNSLPLAKTIGDLARAKEKEGQNLFVAAASLYRQEGALFYLNDPLKALPSYRKATELDPSNPEGWNMLGNVLQRTGDLPGAEAAYLRVDKLAGGDKSVQAVALGNLGEVYRIRGELDKALEFYLKGLEIDKELGRKEGMAAKYANLGTLAETKGDMKTACGHWKKARDLFQELGAPHMVAKNQALLDKANCKK